jgi:hypothetical protein
MPAMKWTTLCLLLIVITFIDEPATAKTPPPAFRDSENLSDVRLQELMHSASSGNSEAALSLARYYWLMKGDMRLTERFFQLAARGGSQKACEALIAFYVQPGGVFRPNKALELRHQFAKQFGYKPGTADGAWAYQSSLDFRYSSDARTASRRRTLLQLAGSLGSKKASEELRDFDRYQTNRVRVSE